MTSRKLGVIDYPLTPAIHREKMGGRTISAARGITNEELVESIARRSHMKADVTVGVVDTADVGSARGLGGGVEDGIPTGNPVQAVAGRRHRNILSLHLHMLE